MSGKIRILSWIWVLIFISFVGSGCGTASISSPNLVNLEVRVWDHREAIDDFSELWLTFSSLGIHPTGQPRTEGWTTLEPMAQSLDLTQYVMGREEVIAQAGVNPGIYNAIRLTIERAEGIVNGQPVEVKVNFETAALDFQIQADRSTVVGLDLMVLDRSDHPGRGYELELREAIVMSNR